MIKALLIHLAIHSFSKCFVDSYQTVGTFLDSGVTSMSKSGTASALEELIGLFCQANN